MRLLKDLDFSGKRVFLRADLDVKPGSNDVVRLQNIKPTVDYVLEHGATRVVIVGHMGRPKQLIVDSSPADAKTVAGRQLTEEQEKLSTRQLVGPLSKILGREFTFTNVILGSEATPESDSGPTYTEVLAGRQARMTNDAEVILLENLRFWSGEEANDPEFAKQLAALADIYVNDSFATAHREHASVVGVPALLPHCAGIHFEQEVEELSRILQDPVRPFIAIVGGVKKETKIPVIANLSKFADRVLVGGWLVNELTKSTDYGLPTSEKIVVATLNPEGKDIDEDSIRKFVEIIKTAKTIVWNGPVGEFETGNATGTIAVAEAIKASGAYSVVGGGETSEFLAQHKIAADFSFVSVGGGAMLEFLAGKSLPGIMVLE